MTLCASAKLGRYDQFGDPMIMTNNPTHLFFFLNNFIFNFIFNIIPNPDLVSKSGPEKQLLSCLINVFC